MSGEEARFEATELLTDASTLLAKVSRDAVGVFAFLDTAVRTDTLPSLAKVFRTSGGEFRL